MQCCSFCRAYSRSVTSASSTRRQPWRFKFLTGMGILYVYLGPSRCPYTRIHEKLRIAKLAGLCADILTTKKHKYSHSRSIDQVLLPCRRENSCARGVDNGMHSDLYRVSHWWFKIFLMSSTVQHDETVKGRQTDHNIM
jgi:hypothetical protein